MALCTACCTHNSVIAIRREGFQKQRILYFTLDGRPLDEDGLSEILKIAVVTRKSSDPEPIKQPPDSVGEEPKDRRAGSVAQAFLSGKTGSREPTPLKPHSVVVAVRLQWATLALGLVRIVVDFARLTSLAGAAFAYLIWIFTFVLMAFLLFKISARKNWARITLLVMFIIGIIPYLPGILADVRKSPLIGTLSIIQTGLQAYALFLLFRSPANLWFRKSSPFSGMRPGGP
jgi:hypothetical protein